MASYGIDFPGSISGDLGDLEVALGGTAGNDSIFQNPVQTGSPAQIAPASGSDPLKLLTQLTQLGVSSYLAVSSRDIQSQQIKAGQVPLSTQGLNLGTQFTSAFQSLGIGFWIVVAVAFVFLLLLFKPARQAAPMFFKR